MQRLKLDHADRIVQQFARSLDVRNEGLEVELAGDVLFKIVPATQLSDREKAALLQEGRELVRRAQARNQGVPARVIEREVRRAVEQVRRRQ